MILPAPRRIGQFEGKPRASGDDPGDYLAQLGSVL